MEKTYWEVVAEEIVADDFILSPEDKARLKKLIMTELKNAHRAGMAYERSNSRGSY